VPLYCAICHLKSQTRPVHDLSGPVPLGPKLAGQVYRVLFRAQNFRYSMVHRPS